MGVDSWAWMAVGFALILAIASRMQTDDLTEDRRAQNSQKDEKPRWKFYTPVLVAKERDERLAGPMAKVSTVDKLANSARLQAEDSGIFEVKVVAIEFDEFGPVMYVNGEFEVPPDENLDVNIVTADITIGTLTDTFTPFDPSEYGESSEKQIGDLINFIEPATLGPTQKGKFRVPMISAEREERMNIAIERLEHAAQALVEKYDSEFSNFSLESDFLAKIESDFINDFVVREIVDAIEQEFIWVPGEVNTVVSFINSYEEVVDEASVRLYLKPAESNILLMNINKLILNTLRAELGLDLKSYDAIVYDR